MIPYGVRARQANDVQIIAMFGQPTGRCANVGRDPAKGGKQSIFWSDNAKT
jgi:hypothetical protein